MITIIGAGRVGSAAAARIAQAGLDDITIIDVVPGLAHGEALDISQAAESGVQVTGTEDFSKMKGSRLVINVAGTARKEGMTRQDLTAKNAEITRTVAQHIKEHAAEAVAVQVANPMDLMAHVLMKASGLPRERVIGMGGLLDSRRFEYFISRDLHLPVSKVGAMVIGEHGEGMVPLASLATAGGRPLRSLLKPARLAEIVSMTRGAGAEVIGLAGATIYAPAACIAAMAAALSSPKGAVMPVSVLLKGEYGISGIFMGVPAKIGMNGLEKVIELGIDADEKAALMDVCKDMHSRARGLGLL